MAFDYGREENLKRYGSVKPLRYDLSKVTVPVYLFWSESDDLVSKEVTKKCHNLVEILHIVLNNSKDNSRIRFFKLGY